MSVGKCPGGTCPGGLCPRTPLNMVIRSRVRQPNPEFLQKACRAP